MLRFIDCNCSVGLPISPVGFRVYEPDAVAHISAACGISVAFAHHHAAFDLHPLDGNAAMDEVCAQNDFFRPVWVVMPCDTGEFIMPEDLPSIMRRQWVKMVRMFPRYNDHGFSLSSWCAGPLLKVLQAEGIPLLLGAEQTGWEDIHTLAASYPRLPVIITNLYYRNSRYMLALLKRHKNLYCETSGLKSFGLLQAFCEQAGYEQLVFGTNMGTYSAGSAVALITYAGISQQAKEAIAHGNLCRILNKDVSSL